MTPAIQVVHVDVNTPTTTISEANARVQRSIPAIVRRGISLVNVMLKTSRNPTAHLSVSRKNPRRTKVPLEPITLVPKESRGENHEQEHAKVQTGAVQPDRQR